MMDNAGVPRGAGPTIYLRSGLYFDLGEPRACPFTIEDVAHSLAHICRFGGHTHRFYSVAEHSVWCSRIVPPEHALEALLHDAAEAFIGDVTRPLKSMLPSYRALEASVEAAVFARLGIGPVLHESVREADRRMLVAEQRQAMACADTWPGLEDVEPAPVVLDFLEPSAAAQLFLREYERWAPKGRGHV
jgi:hypothetical protein